MQYMSQTEQTTAIDDAILASLPPRERLKIDGLRMEVQDYLDTCGMRWDEVYACAFAAVEGDVPPRAQAANEDKPWGLLQLETMLGDPDVALALIPLLELHMHAWLVLNHLSQVQRGVPEGSAKGTVNSLKEYRSRHDGLVSAYEQFGMPPQQARLAVRRLEQAGVSFHPLAPESVQVQR